MSDANALVRQWWPMAKLVARRVAKKHLDLAGGRCHKLADDAPITDTREVEIPKKCFSKNGRKRGRLSEISPKTAKNRRGFNAAGYRDCGQIFPW